MQIIKKVFGFVVLIGLFVGLGVVTKAQTIFVRQDNSLSGTGGPVVVAETMNACHYTPWIAVNNFREVVFDNYYTSAAGAVVDLVTTCQSSEDALTADGAGLDVQGVSIVCAAPWCDATLNTARWHKTSTAGAGAVTRYSFSVTRVPGKFLKCYFCATGGLIADLLSVDARGITP